jgi:hypothetical protein
VDAIKDTNGDAGTSAVRLKLVETVVAHAETLAGEAGNHPQ